MPLIVALVIIAVTWAVTGWVCWYHLARPDGDAWNWRALVHPGLYYRWLLEQRNLD